MLGDKSNAFGNSYFLFRILLINFFLLNQISDSLLNFLMNFTIRSSLIDACQKSIELVFYTTVKCMPYLVHSL
jgi:hypothetical protein